MADTDFQTLGKRRRTTNLAGFGGGAELGSIREENEDEPEEIAGQMDTYGSDSNIEAPSNYDGDAPEPKKHRVDVVPLTATRLPESLRISPSAIDALAKLSFRNPQATKMNSHFHFQRKNLLKATLED